MLETQLKLEQESRDKGVEQFKRSLKEAEERVDLNAHIPYKRLISVCLQDVADIIRDQLESINTSSSRSQYGVHIKKAIETLQYNQLAYITLKETMQYLASPKDKHNISSLKFKVGLAVEHLIICKEFQRDYNALYQSISKELTAKRVRDEKHRRSVLIMNAMDHIDRARWSTSLRASVGTFLVKTLIDNSDLISTSRRGMLSVSDEAKGWLQKVLDHISGTLMAHQPCVVPPDDWTTLQDGGYKSLESKYCSPIIDSRYHKVFKNRNIKEHLDAVNNIQKVEWRINSKLLEVANTIWQSKNTTIFPSREPLIPPPYPLPKDLKKEDMQEAEISRFKNWKKRASEVYTAEKIRFSKVLSTSSTLQMANKMQKYDSLWFVWYCDYRGRMYPRSTVLSPQGDCLNKAILQFKEGKEIDDRGAYWLAVHGANSYGEDKINYDDRVKFIQSIQDDVLLYAEDPYNNTGWMDADSPWVFLAFCIEWHEYITTGSLVSHIPVAIDGTCNGLQHFSALLKDEIGASHTNLLDSEIPSDIYQVVADKVTTRLSTETSPHARVWLDVGITRSLCKRSVMTLPYGVKPQTVSDHVFEYIKDNNIQVPESYSACFYLGRIIWDCMGEVVHSAVCMLDYIRKYSPELLKKGRLVWTSPTGFPVSVSKTKTKTVRIAYTINKIRYLTAFNNELPNIDVQRCINSVAPNYIHSLDAAHLVKTVNRCVKEGITGLSCIHDSFGTHASEVDTLHAILRDTFIGIYKNDLLSKLCAETGLPVEHLPEYGNLDITRVYDSKYFFN